MARHSILVLKSVANLAVLNAWSNVEMYISMKNLFCGEVINARFDFGNNENDFPDDVEGRFT